MKEINNTEYWFDKIGLKEIGRPAPVVLAEEVPAKKATKR